MVSELLILVLFDFRVFNQNNLIKLRGYYGLGHVRYPTAGSPDRNEAQPFYTNYPYDFKSNFMQLWHFPCPQWKSHQLRGTPCETFM